MKEKAKMSTDRTFCTGGTLGGNSRAMFDERRGTAKDCEA
jgi:hypothetical protein